MSKKIQGIKTREEFAAAKPRYMFDFSRNLLNVRHDSSVDSDASNILVIPQLESSVPASTWKHVQDRVQNPATHSQEWHTGNPCL